jgi:hypothetical protein
MICGCGSENEFFQIDENTELVVEKFDDCEFCGSRHIEVSILREKDRNCFVEWGESEKKKLAYWNGKDNDRVPIRITLQDFEVSLKRKLEDAFEEVWDVLPEEECDKLSDKFIEMMEDKFIELFLRRIKEE